MEAVKRSGVVLYMEILVMYPLGMQGKDQSLALLASMGRSIKRTCNRGSKKSFPNTESLGFMGPVGLIHINSQGEPHGSSWGVHGSPVFRGCQAHHSISWMTRDGTYPRGIGAEAGGWLSPIGHDCRNSHTVYEPGPL